MKKISNDINGNPRWVVGMHWILEEKEGEGLSILERFDLAVKKARKVGGKVYKGKDFGGGIVFQSYNILETLKKAKGGI
jgi:hypothetical protein